MDEVFSSLAKFNRQKVKIIVGEPIGPFEVQVKGKKRREKLDDIGIEIIQSIAELIPKEKHGFLSDDPEIRSMVVDYP